MMRTIKYAETAIFLAVMSASACAIGEECGWRRVCEVPETQIEWEETPSHVRSLSRLVGALDIGLSNGLPASDFGRIKELARALDHDPDKCYRYVRDNIAYASYAGLLKGPERTLLDREGNELDQSFLLFALLRASGFTDAGIGYAPLATSNGVLTSCFLLPLRAQESASEYNAADWLGVDASGYASDVASRVMRLHNLAVYHGISPRAKFGWITGIVNDLVVVKDIKPVQLYCYRYKLKARLERLLSEAADRIREKAYQEVFAFGQETYTLQLDLDRGFAFDEAMYADAPLMKVYRGGTRFAKHYLGPNCVPAFDGEKKDGEGEEFDCAVQIDAHPAVRFWLRNLAKHHRSFSLPLSHDSFYPDFVGELTDGRLFAVEYKGEHLRNAKDTLEKDAIGRLWAAKSSGKCLYATVFKSDDGLDVKGQLDKIFPK